MRIANVEISFLKSRVARRMFGLFVFCALLPLLILSGFTFLFVSDELEEQAERRLRQTCKAKGFEIYEHLLFLETELKMIASDLKKGVPQPVRLVPYASDKGAGSRIRNLVLVRPDGSVRNLLGSIRPIPQQTGPERAHLAAGNTLVMTRPETPHHAVLMARRIDHESPSSPMLLAEVNPVYLWGIGSEGSLPRDTEIVIHNPQSEVLISSLPVRRADDRLLNRLRHPSPRSYFEFQLEGERYIAATWKLFIKYRFFVPGWTIILAESRAGVLSPVSSFKLFFILMVLLTFWVVALLSVALIRKSLVPIETLRAATDRIAEGELGTRVNIDSGDEFETLGRSFNEMSRKLEEGQRLLVQSAKMSAFGQMSAGVVHEIGQPLTSLLGLVELMLDEPMNDEQRSQLEMFQSELVRLKEMIIKFKSFSRAPEGVQEEVDLNRLLEETHRLLEHQFHMKGIEFVMKKGDGLPSVRGDRSGLQQVLVNLTINAMDALEEDPEGQGLIRVRTYALNGRVCLSISDNGPGIPKEIQDRIFDPFFTTKPAGEGTGLGLAIIHSIVHQHHGTIRLDTDPDSGTRFVVELPANGPSGG
jgi:signal transduction histidine kinase